MDSFQNREAIQGGAESAAESEDEITPAMIAAGVSALLEFDSRFESEADAVVDIFRAMIAAKEAAHPESRIVHT